MSKSKKVQTFQRITFNHVTIHTSLHLQEDVSVNDDNTFSLVAKKYVNYFPRISSDTKFVVTTQINYLQNTYTLVDFYESTCEESTTDKRVTKFLDTKAYFVNSEMLEDQDSTTFVFSNQIDNRDILNCMCLYFHEANTNSYQIDFTKLIIIRDNFCKNIILTEYYMKMFICEKPNIEHQINLSNVEQQTYLLNVEQQTYLSNIFFDEKWKDVCNIILNFLPIDTIKTLREVSKQFKNIIYNLPYSYKLKYYDLPDDTESYDAYIISGVEVSKWDFYESQKIPDFRWLINFMPNTVCASMNDHSRNSKYDTKYHANNNPSYFLHYSDIFKLQNLKTLRVIGFVNISSIENLTKLENLCLQYCVHIVTDHMIRNLVNLQYLNFTVDCGGGDITDISISRLVKLRHLVINDNIYITDISISQLINLHHLDIYSCTSITDASIEILTNLQHLNIGCCNNITDKSVEKLTNLKYLNISHCKNITDASISKLTKLETLIMSDCNKHLISSDILTTLQHLSNLKIYKCLLMLVLYVFVVKQNHISTNLKNVKVVIKIVIVV